MSFFSGTTPFVTAYWPVLVSVFLFVITAVLFLPSLLRKNTSAAKEKSERASQENGKTVSPSKHEDPLAEFDDSPAKLDSELPELVPPRHSEDTPHIPYKGVQFSEEEMVKRTKEFYELMNKRRSVRHYSSKSVPKEVVENIIRTAGTSPSGAHSEPWTFVVVEDKMTKSKIREVVEQEEYINYDRRMGDKWVQDLKFVRTTHEKSYLEDAPYLIVVFKQPYSTAKDGRRQPHYYYEVSTAIACGFLVMAIHNAGLVTVTSTPMNAGGAIRELLGRPESEKVMLLLPIGYPAEGAEVPDIARKPLNDILVWE